MRTTADNDALLLRGQITCSQCRKPIRQGAARAILYLSPMQFSAACLECSQKEAGLNEELARVPVVPSCMKVS
jgi:hypothetical protein